MNQQKISIESKWMMVGSVVTATGLYFLISILIGKLDPDLVTVLLGAGLSIVGACIFLVGLFGRIFLVDEEIWIHDHPY